MTHNVDLEKLAQYVMEARHFLDKADHLVQQAMLKQDTSKIDETVEKDEQ